MIDTPRLEVPTIDLSGWWHGGAVTREAIARQLDRAARTVGFMQIVGHRIPPHAIAGLTGALDQFFGLAPDVKRRYVAPPAVNRGYTPPRSEKLSYSLGLDSPADLFEAFNVGAHAGQFPGFDLDPVVYADNVWPHEAPRFERGVWTWFEHVQALARTMEEVLALALGLPTDHFAAYTDHSIDVLRMVNYAVPEGTQLEPDQLGMGAHTDYGIITILWADPVVGLQILDGDGRWRSVVPSPGVLLVNLGDLLARWTNDQWTSTMHRVVPPLDHEGRSLRRRSAAFFHDGNSDAVVSTLAPCRAADGSTPYDDVTVAEHLAQKLGGSRGLELNDHAAREAARVTVAGA